MEKKLTTHDRDLVFPSRRQLTPKTIRKMRLDLPSASTPRARALSSDSQPADHASDPCRFGGFGSIAPPKAATAPREEPCMPRAGHAKRRPIAATPLTRLRSNLTTPTQQRSPAKILHGGAVWRASGSLTVSCGWLDGRGMRGWSLRIRSTTSPRDLAACPLIERSETFRAASPSAVPSTQCDSAVPTASTSAREPVHVHLNRHLTEL